MILISSLLELNVGYYTRLHIESNYAFVEVQFDHEDGLACGMRSISSLVPERVQKLS